MAHQTDDFYTPQAFAKKTHLGRDRVYRFCVTRRDDDGNPFPGRNVGTERKPRYIIHRDEGDEWFRRYIAGGVPA